MDRILKTFIAGLLVLLPALITLALVGWAMSILVQYLGPESGIGRLLSSIGLSVGPSSAAPYVIGILVLFAAVFLLGLLVQTRLGTWLSVAAESLLMRVPVVSRVYDLSKRFTSIVGFDKESDVKSMSSVWCFFGGEPGAAVLALLPSSQPVMMGGESYLGILIPSAPVPLGGALIYVPAGWVRPAKDGVDKLMSVYVSMGVTPPTGDVVSNAGG